MSHIAQIIAQTRRTEPAATPEPAELHPAVKRWAWRYRLYTPVHERMFAETVRWCSDALHGLPGRWLSVLGPSGTGKTYLLSQAINLLRWAAGAGLWKVPYAPDGRTVTGRISPQVAHIRPQVDLDTYSAPREWAAMDALFVEDIGAGTEMDRGAGKIVRDRVAELLQLRTGKWTALDANLHRGAIEALFDGRIASRLKRDGSVCIELPEDTPDYEHQ